MENTYTINIDAILELASIKKGCWLMFNEAGDKDYANDYWNEYFGIIQTLQIITGKRMTDVMDMVYDWDKAHN